MTSHYLRVYFAFLLLCPDIMYDGFLYLSTLGSVTQDQNV